MYVPTGDNPADLITRQQDATKMKTETLWSEGPAFLKKPEEEWPAQDKVYNLFPEGCEIKMSVFKTVIKEQTETSVLEYFSGTGYTKGVRLLARMIQEF